MEKTAGEERRGTHLRSGHGVDSAFESRKLSGVRVYAKLSGTRVYAKPSGPRVFAENAPHARTDSAMERLLRVLSIETRTVRNAAGSAFLCYDSIWEVGYRSFLNVAECDKVPGFSRGAA